MPTMAPPPPQPLDKHQANNADCTGRKTSHPATTGMADRTKDNNPMLPARASLLETTMPWTQVPLSARLFRTKKKRNIAHRAAAMSVASRDTSHGTARSKKTAKDKLGHDLLGQHSPNKARILSSSRKQPPKVLIRGHLPPGLL